MTTPIKGSRVTTADQQEGSVLGHNVTGDQTADVFIELDDGGVKVVSYPGGLTVTAIPVTAVSQMHAGEHYRIPGFPQAWTVATDGNATWLWSTVSPWEIGAESLALGVQAGVPLTQITDDPSLFQENDIYQVAGTSKHYLYSAGGLRGARTFLDLSAANPEWVSRKSIDGELVLVSRTSPVGSP